MLIITEPGSDAVSYALNNNLDFNADTQHRALVIGQTDYPGNYKLEGPEKDIINIQNILDGYEITTMQNLTGREILDAIATAFVDASDEDISLFYYAGHGKPSNGAFIGIDMNSYVTASDLRTALDQVPGRKIVLVDACYSGTLIGRSSAKKSETDPAALFIEDFTAKRSLRSSNLAAKRYFVIVPSKGSELSWEASYGGIFTEAFVNSRTNADTDNDGVITFEEAYLYTKETVTEVAGSGGKTQSVQAYPEDCYWFGLFR